MTRGYSGQKEEGDSEEARTKVQAGRWLGPDAGSDWIQVDTAGFLTDGEGRPGFWVLDPLAPSTATTPF